MTKLETLRNMISKRVVGAALEVNVTERAEIEVLVELYKIEFRKIVAAGLADE